MFVEVPLEKCHFVYTMALAFLDKSSVSLSQLGSPHDIHFVNLDYALHQGWSLGFSQKNVFLMVPKMARWFMIPTQLLRGLLSFSTVRSPCD
jgi:hypothetical protein